MKRWATISLALLTTGIAWLLLITENLIVLSPKERLHAKLTPIYAVILLGIYAASSVLFKVYTFNECHDAYEELKDQIKLARADLRTHGFKI